MAKSTMACAGIDTGKRKLDVALQVAPHGRAEQLQVDNTATGHQALSGWLRRHRVRRVGIEASGGYEAPVVAELRRAGFVVIVFQPAQVRAYAKFVLQRGRTTGSTPPQMRGARRRPGRSMPHPIRAWRRSPSI